MPSLDKDEYARLLRENQTKLWTLAAAIVGDRTLAEDVVQEAAITGLRRLADFEVGTNFSAWISQIVRYTALNYRKSSKRRMAVSLDGHNVVEADPTAETPHLQQPVSLEGEMLPEQQAFDDTISRAVQDLEADRRACFLLRVVHQLDYDEISKIVDVPAGTAMSHVHRAKTALRRALASDGEPARG